MLSISRSLRAAAVAVVVAAGASAGIASASAKTAQAHAKAKVTHASAKAKKHGRVKEHPHGKKHKHVKKHAHGKKHKHVKKHSRAVRHAPTVKQSAKQIGTSAARKNAPAKTTPTKTTPPTKTATTTAASTTPTTSTSSSTLQPAGISGSWKLVLDSEFDGSSLDTSVWRTGWFNSTGISGPINSLETACYSPSQVTFPGDGTMHLNLSHTASTCSGVSEPWTGAVVTTNPDDGRASGGFQYTYGAVETRVYLPADGTGVANWPAFWSDGQSWPNDGEDDIMESMGNQMCSTFHDPLGAPHVCMATGGITPGWHTFAADWEPGSVTYYYDGKDVGTVTTGVTSAPMYLVLDNTVDATGYADNVADSMQVQYVRVWQHS